jgi:hypothetical protein
MPRAYTHAQPIAPVFTGMTAWAGTGVKRTASALNDQPSGS